jgi:hypothetical protein
MAVTLSVGAVRAAALKRLLLLTCGIIDIAALGANLRARTGSVSGATTVDVEGHGR